MNEAMRSANVSALYPLAVKAADAGDYARVSELFAAAEVAALSPADAARWQRLLTEAGDFTAAATLGVQRCSAPQEEPGSTPAPPALSVGAVLPPDPDPGDDFLDFDPGPRESAEPAAPEPIVEAMLRWFGGRGDVYARQWYDARRDQSGYWPVRAPLAARVIEQHLLGRITVGQYVMHPDSTVSFAALDLDPTAAALEQQRLAADAEGALALPALVEYARRIVETASRAGLAVVPEDTGGAGMHVWVFFEPRLPAARARALLRELLYRAGPQPPAVAVEVFPKQDQLSGKGLGNLIKLPLGVHQVTLRPSRFLDHTLQPIEPAEAVSRLRACDPVALETLLASRVVPLRTGTNGESAPTRSPAPPPPAPAGPIPRALAEALAVIPPGRPAQQAADRILAGCAVVRELARHAHEERALGPDAARALLYTVGLVGRDSERIEAMFASAGVSRKELDRVRRGLQGPMGCNKLRQRFPGRCQGCAEPTPPAGGYASPALFALRERPSLRRTAPAWPLPPDVGADPGDASVVEITQRLGRLETALANVLRELHEER